MRRPGNNTRMVCGIKVIRHDSYVRYTRLASEESEIRKKSNESSPV